jgi:hypothetical protein
MAERSNSDCSYRAPAFRLDSPLRAVLIANNLGAPILPHERDNLSNNLARIKWRTRFVKNVENYFTVTFPMGNSRRETIITPPARVGLPASSFISRYYCGRAHTAIPKQTRRPWWRCTASFVMPL